jgi:hypothetical protein
LQQDTIPCGLRRNEGALPGSAPRPVSVRCLSGLASGIGSAFVRWVRAGTGRRQEITSRYRVVETDIHHPTDSTLLWDTVRVITRLVQRQGEIIPRGVSTFHDRTRAAKRRHQRTSNQGGQLAPVTTILAALFDRGFFLITISTSRSSALRKCIRRCTENPSNRQFTKAEIFGLRQTKPIWHSPRSSSARDTVRCGKPQEPGVRGFDVQSFPKG